jgi:hypothetical protein
LEFACGVRNYPECEHFEQDVAKLRAIKMFWQQGAGINLSVCAGYLTKQSILLELWYVVYLEVYLKTLLELQSWLLHFLSSYCSLMAAGLVQLRYCGKIMYGYHFKPA